MKNITAKLVLLGFFLEASSVIAGEVDLDLAGNLLKQGKAGQAYSLLAPHEYDRAGDLNYDYLLGVAALDSGRPDRATLALERVLATDPGYAGARLDLARAYFAMGNYAQARSEFEAVIAQGPPAPARKVIDQYIAAIDERTSPRKTVLTGYAELTLGTDSNVSAATYVSSVNLFGTLPVTLDAASTQTGDLYSSQGWGVELNHGLDANWGLFAGVDGRKRMNRSDDTFNQGSLDGRIGVSYTEGRHVYRASLNGGQFFQDDKYYRSSRGGNMEWRYAPDARNQLGVFAQRSELRYRNTTYESYDVNQQTYGASWMHLYALPMNPVAFGNVFMGSEDDLRLRDDGWKHFAGFRLGGQVSPRPDTDIYAFLGWQHGRYRETNPYFSRFREDGQYDISLGANWRYAPDWVVKPMLAHTKVDSNVPYNEYRRTDVSVTLRHDFR